jgi:hypothetical protein
VAYACLQICLSLFDKTLGSPHQGSSRLWLNLTRVVFHLGFRGSMVFCIEKPRVLVAALLSWKIGVCRPYGLV